MQTNWKKIANITIMVCLIIIAVLSYLFYNKTKECISLRKNYLIERTNRTTFQNVLSRNLNAIQSLDYMQLDKKEWLFMVSKSKRDSIPINQLKNVITLFVPKHSCNVCYDEIYDALQYAEEKIKKGVIVVTHKEKYNEVKNMISDLRINSTVYYLCDETFWSAISVEYAPFLSMVDTELKCRHCFVPFPNYPELSYSYLENLHKRYMGAIAY